MSPKSEKPDASSPPDQPWYKDGLKFTCTQCGDCCTGFEGFVWVNEEEMQAIADHLGESIGAMKLEHTRKVGRKVSLKEFANGDCTFFDGATRGCKIYPVRPRQCRTWPFWDSNLESPAAWRETKKLCPGTGTGTFFSLEEIEAKAAVIRL
jgi:hypothetical protein